MAQMLFLGGSTNRKNIVYVGRSTNAPNFAPFLNWAAYANVEAFNYLCTFIAPYDQACRFFSRFPFPSKWAAYICRKASRITENKYKFEVREEEPIHFFFLLIVDFLKHIHWLFYFLLPRSLPKTMFSSTRQPVWITVCFDEHSLRRPDWTKHLGNAC